jgi:NTP pyrophosphatase (non-canonical NTP hydrolase)
MENQELSTVGWVQIASGFDQYQKEAMKTALYKDAVDKLDPEADAPNLRQILKLSYAALGLGESGEVQGKIKKIIRDANGIIDEERRTAIKKELGDTLWYIAMIAEELSLSLGDIAVANIDKLQSRKERGALHGDGDTR